VPHLPLAIMGFQHVSRSLSTHPDLRWFCIWDMGVFISHLIGFQHVSRSLSTHLDLRWFGYWDMGFSFHIWLRWLFCLECVIEVVSWLASGSSRNLEFGFAIHLVPRRQWKRRPRLFRQSDFAECWWSLALYGWILFYS
jgi:hypothetical protein